MKNIIFIAPPASGKGTMSELLIEKYGYTHISTGDILREMAKVDDSLGHTIKDLLQKGELIPDDIVYSAVERRLAMKDLDNGYILDGFPRNLSQALEYDKILEKIHRDLGVVIELITDKETLERRITGRRICSECKATYNVLTGVNTPRNEHICDKCGGMLYQREDDNYESFQNRYQTYLDKTLPLVDYYKEKNVLFSVSSLKPEDTIKEIEAIIND